MKKLIIVLFVMLNGCGMNVHVDKIKADPVEVNHNFNINFESVMAYCNNQCAPQSQDPLVIQACTNACYQNFINILSNALNPGVPVK